MGQLIQAAYAPGTKDPPAYALPPGLGYALGDVIYGNDLATDIGEAKLSVPFGFTAKTPGNDLVVVIRGTQGIWEWMQDARVLRVPCPLAPGAGQTEDGFTAVYQSLAVGGTSLLSYLKAIAPRCDHHRHGAQPGCSPGHLVGLRPGGQQRIHQSVRGYLCKPASRRLAVRNTYNNEVPNTWRIANVPDPVPGLPGAGLGYDHVDQLVRSELRRKCQTRAKLHTCTEHLLVSRRPATRRWNIPVRRLLRRVVAVLTPTRCHAGRADRGRHRQLGRNGSCKSTTSKS